MLWLAFAVGTLQTFYLAFRFAHAFDGATATGAVSPSNRNVRKCPDLSGCGRITPSRHCKRPLEADRLKGGGFGPGTLN